MDDLKADTTYLTNVISYIYIVVAVCVRHMCCKVTPSAYVMKKVRGKYMVKYKQV